MDVVYALKDEVQELKQVSVCDGVRKLCLIFKLISEKIIFNSFHCLVT